MALEKKNISLDLIQGADTKANNQIDTGYQDMENVVFTGDMTVKKMNGFDVVETLPATEKFSLLSRMKNDLLAFSDNGVYRYNETGQAFNKISENTTSQIESTGVIGKFISFSDNYYCVHDESVNNSVDSGKTSFYSVDGTLINTIYGNQFASQLAGNVLKIVSFGDAFYFCLYVQASLAIFISKYEIDVGTGLFVYSAHVGSLVTVGTMNVIDFATDGNEIFCCYYINNGGVNSIVAVKWLTSSTGGAAPTASSTIASLVATSIELFNKNTTQIYISIVINAGASNYPHDLLVCEKISLGVSSEVPLGVYNNSGRLYSCPISDTSAVAIIIKNPMGQIFKQGDCYYIGQWFYNRGQIFTKINKLIQVGVSTTWVARPVAICESSNVKFNSSPFTTLDGVYGTLNPVCSSGGFNYITSYNSLGLSVLIKFKADAEQKSSYIEIDKSNIISNGLPLYYDGDSISEFGFLDVPQVDGYTTDLTGTLPADTYFVVCIYEWKDANGNTFFSQHSSPFKLVAALNTKLFLEVAYNLNTDKKNILLKVYIRGTNKLYQLTNTYNLSNGGSLNIGVEVIHVFTISSYPSVNAELAPYQDGSIQPEIITNTQSVSLYSDRIITMSKDAPLSIAYSQQKVPYDAFEFNNDTFYLDVLDKRGVNEDGLTGSVAMDGRLIIFKENSILYINGSGPSRANSNDDFSAPLLITTDAGCTEPRSVVLTPNGVMFKTDKGIYLLDRKLQVQYIGASVERFNSNTITSAILIEGVNEVRFTTLEGEILVYNYFSSAWSWFTALPAVSACLWKNKFVLLTTDNRVLIESKTHKKIIDGATNSEIIQKISSPWIRIDRVQGWEKAYEVRIIGDYKSAHKMIIKVFYDYELYISEEYTIDPLTSDQYNTTVRPTNEDLENGTKINGVYQIRVDLIRKNCQAFRIEITDDPLDIANNTGESFALSNVTFTVGLKKGAAKIQALKSN